MATTPAPPSAEESVPGCGLTRLEGATLAALLALAGIELVGYRFGDSNHGITVPILKRFMDRSLYSGDPMVATGERFPTVFYRALAAVLPGTDWVPAAFFVLYVLSIALALAGVYRIGRWFGGSGAGLVAMLVAIPVRVGIANEALYRVEFSHSHLASALVIWAIAWLLEGRRMLPLLALSLGAYNHLLYSVYVLVPLLLVVLAERKHVGPRRTLQRIAAGVVPLVPFALWTLAHRTPMTREWLDLLRLRSSHHSFPSAFGDSLAAACCLLALGALTLSRLSPEKRALVATFLLGIALQFVAGTVFTEFLPLKAVLQFQPHRCWRFLVLLLYGLAAEGIVAGWRAGGAARAAAVVTGVILVDPRFEPLLPVAVFLQAALGRPAAATWARLLAVATLAWLMDWPRPELDLASLTYPIKALGSETVVGAAALALVVLIGREAGAVIRPLAAAGAAAATLAWLAPSAYADIRPKWERGPWIDVQHWIRTHTPKTAAIVSPPREAGFRVFSERTIVGEWKDGTQQYFDDAFAGEWAVRMEAFGKEEYNALTDEQLLVIAQRFGASYVVHIARRRHPVLKELYKNSYFGVYAVPAAGPR